MKILLVTDGIFPFVIGGMQKHAYYLSHSLSHLGHEVHVIVPKLKGGKRYDATIDNIKYHEIERKSWRFPLHYLLEEWQYSSKCWDFIFSSKKNFPGFDAIITKGFTTVAWKKNRDNVPLVYSQLHGLEMFQRTINLRTKLEYFPLRIFAERVLKVSDVILSYGGKIKMLHENVLGSDEKLFLFHGGVLEERVVKKIEITRRPVRLLFIGRNERRKGIPELNKMLNAMLSSGANFEIDWVGELPKPQQIDSEKVYYHGLVSSAEKYNSILDRCDVLLLPSISEGFPTVILEAMSRGLTVLAMNVGAISEIITSSNGWLEEDYSGFQSKLKEIIQLSTDEIDSKKKNALLTVKNEYLWDTLAQSLTNMIQSRNDSR